MGTNYIEFILETFRILKEGGFLVIAEVISRIKFKIGFVNLIYLVNERQFFYDPSNTNIY